MPDKEPLNIFYIVDKNFIIHFAVSLTSLLENNKDINVVVYVIHDLENTAALDKVIDFLKGRFSVDVKLIKINNKLFDNLPINENISKASYFRLLFADILPRDVSSGFYIDCDTIITASLKELLTIGFSENGSKEDYSLLAVEDNNGSKELRRLETFGVHSGFYFNAGVLLVNLDKWRRDDVSGNIIKIAEQYKDHLTWHDQDVLNIFFLGKCGQLDETYNKITKKRVAQIPVVIHFSGSSKPWQYLNDGPYKSLYWKYLKMTPFKGQKFEKISFKKRLRKYIDKYKKYAKQKKGSMNKLNE